MKSGSIKRTVRYATLAFLLTIASRAHAITAGLSGTASQNADTTVFFSGGPHEAGFTGNVTSASLPPTSTVTGTQIVFAGNSSLPDLSDGNGFPIGVKALYDITFVVDATSANTTLNDGGNGGLGLRGPTDTTTAERNRIHVGEQVRFSNINITDVTFIDPLGLLSGTTGTAANGQFRSVRSGDFNSPNDAVTVSSDAAATQDVSMPVIDDAFGATFGPLSTVYFSTTASDGWRLKGIGWRADLTFDLNPSPPPTRRTFKFADLPALGATYDGQGQHSILDDDTTVSITAVGGGDLGTTLSLDTSEQGVGVNSSSDDAEGEGGQRRINGILGEAIHITFDQDVSLESLTLGSFEFASTPAEAMTLSFVSGNNPFRTDFAGYSSAYTLGADFISYSLVDPKSDSPHLITFGIGGQDPIMIEAGTVLAYSANPVNSNGILLDMITVQVDNVPVFDGDYNNDGVVDGADYVMWMKTDSANDDGYAAIVQNFGNSSPGSGGNGAVPEPSAMVLSIFAFMAVAWRRQRSAA
jgi:hypothetical protein